MMDRFNPEELDPGIRELVLELRASGFDTTDSGDGYSKGEIGEPYPHVHMVVPRASAFEEADRLQQWCFQELDEPADIQLTYSPADRVCLLSLYPRNTT